MSACKPQAHISEPVDARGPCRAPLGVRITCALAAAVCVLVVLGGQLGLAGYYGAQVDRQIAAEKAGTQALRLAASGPERL